MKEIIGEITPKLKEVFEHLHTHPEISWKEFETTNYIKELLEAEGFHVHTFHDSTGLYVEIGSGKPVIGVRTDMDALWQEVDGEFKANHSCGHDGHMTMAIGVLFALKRLNLSHKGTIRVLFQPAEEKGQGALSLIQKGIIDDINYLFGMHVRPIQELADGKFSPAIYHGAARLFSGVIHGEEAHGARPHLGKNAIEIGASLVDALKSIHIDPMIPASVKMTKFQAGGVSSNVIPGSAEFFIDARAQKNEGIAAIQQGINRAIRSVEALYDCRIDLTTEANAAAAEINEEAQAIMASAIIDAAGKESLQSPIVTPGGEDFHFYTLERPHVKATMLGLGCGLTPGLHHPKMTFNHAQILLGVEILTRTVLNALTSSEQEVATW